MYLDSYIVMCAYNTPQFISFFHKLHKCNKALITKIKMMKISTEAWIGGNLHMRIQNQSTRDRRSTGNTALPTTKKNQITVQIESIN